MHIVKSDRALKLGCFLCSGAGRSRGCCAVSDGQGCPEGGWQKAQNGGADPNWVLHKKQKEKPEGGRGFLKLSDAWHVCSRMNQRNERNIAELVCM